MTPSVGPTEAASIARWIKGACPPTVRVVDVGAGVGHLQRACQDIGIECYSIEGSREALLHLAGDPGRFAIADLSKPLPDGLHHGFDLVTAFEFLEHVPRHLIPAVLDNIRLLGTRLIGSIHVANEENEFHKTIQPFAAWWEWAHLSGITLVERPELQAALGVTHWTCSVFVEGMWE